MKRVRSMGFVTGVQVAPFYKWLKTFVDRHPEIQGMVYKVVPNATVESNKSTDSQKETPTVDIED